MKLTKALGLLLLLLGLALIFYGIFSSYQVFTNATQPPTIFVVSPTSTQKPASNGSEAGISGLLGGLVGIDVGKVMGGEIQKILPADYLPKLLNLLSWSVFTSLLIFASSQVAGLGIKLLKD